MKTDADNPSIRSGSHDARRQLVSLTGRSFECDDIKLRASASDSASDTERLASAGSIR